MIPTIVKRIAVVAASMSLMLGLLTACGSSDAETEQPGELVGLLSLTPGAYENGEVSGSWFRMVQPGGTPADGPFMPNGDSPVEAGAATLLQPGSAGGLQAGSYQSEPDPAFAEGNSLAGSIMKPTRFFGVDFGASTNPIDPQTQNAVIAPRVRNDNGKLTANLSAWAASWNNQEFNQGAPKAPARAGAQVPGAKQVKQAWDFVSQKWFGQEEASEGEGPPATGTYDPETRAYTLEWTSLIVDGPFNGFTGVWHLEGVFSPGPATPSRAPATSAP